MSKTVWRGVTVDTRTAAMLDALAALTGDIYINPTQGSYSGSVSASAGTHDGCGAVDLMHPSWSVDDYDTVARQSRRVGFAAWHRTPQQSNWPRHVHAIAVQPGGRDDRGCLSSGAHQQVADYYAGRNGLASNAPDDGPRQFVGTTWETYQREEDTVTPQDIDKIAEAVAQRVNGILGDYDADGKQRDGQDGVRGDVRLRRIEKIVRKLRDKA